MCRRNAQSTYPHVVSSQCLPAAFLDPEAFKANLVGRFKCSGGDNFRAVPRPNSLTATTYPLRTDARINGHSS